MRNARCIGVALLSISVLVGGEDTALADVETADRLFQASKWQSAREAYEAVLPESTGNEAARVLRQIGYTWQIQHQHEKALPYFERALEIPEIDAEHRSGAWLRMGYSLRLLGRGQEGIAALEKAINVPGAPANHVAEALLYAAWEHNSREQHAEALDKFRQVATVQGVHTNYIATAQLNIGRILQRQQQYEEAIAAFQKIASLNPVAAVNRARARVYTLECQALLAGDTPFHIKPYVIAVTSTSAKVCWVSQGEVLAGSVSIRREISAGTKAKDSPAKDSPAKQLPATATALPDTICQLKTAVLDGLRAGTHYKYEVHCGDQTACGKFRTAPEPGTPFSFCLIGDTQSYHEGLQPLLDAMADHPCDFVLHVGDITDRGNLWGEWKASFFDPGWGYLKNRAIWPVYGNHDGGPYFPALFDLRKNYWYSFDWGDAHFIVLDSYGAGSGGRGRAEQLAWLANDLKANRQPWTFVALHVPMVATRRSLKWFGEDDFLPLLERHGVDVVFSGHHPHYRRYDPLGSHGNNPILHITSGGGGGPVGGFVPSPLLAQGVNVNHYCRIRVSRDRFELTAHAISGAEIDRFELVKHPQSESNRQAIDSQQAKRLIAVYQELLTDRTFELRLRVSEKPAANGPVKFTLDLSKLPRGPLPPDHFEEDTVLSVRSMDDSPWHLPRQTVRLRDGILTLNATAPNDVSTHGTSITPPARLEIQLRKGDREFAPFRTAARLQIVGDD